MCDLSRKAASTLVTTDAVQVHPGKASNSQICGRDPERQSVTVINDPDGTVAVYLVGDQNAGQSQGIKLKPGASITLETTAPLWITPPAAVVATVYVVTESGAVT